MIIRPIQSTDLRPLADLAAKTFTDTFGHLYHTDDLKAHLEKAFSLPFFEDSLEKDHILIAEEQGQIAGYAKFGDVGLPIDHDPQADQELHRLYIDKPYLGKGIAPLLMTEMMKIPSMQQAKTIYLGVWENNSRAQKFYQKYGFEKIGEYDYPVGNHIDREWIMKLEK